MVSTNTNTDTDTERENSAARAGSEPGLCNAANVDDTVSVDEALLHVVHGRQEQVLALLEKFPKLIHLKGCIIDEMKDIHGQGREPIVRQKYEGITIFQLAVALLDWRMWQAIRHYLSDDDFTTQMRFFETAPGKQFLERNIRALRAVVDALQCCVQRYEEDYSRHGEDTDKYNYADYVHLWKKVGVAQCQLPVHIYQLYVASVPFLDIRSINAFFKQRRLDVVATVYGIDLFWLRENGMFRSDRARPTFAPRALEPADIAVQDARTLQVILRDLLKFVDTLQCEAKECEAKKGVVLSPRMSL
jgi:hypothetical protein